VVGSAYVGRPIERQPGVGDCPDWKDNFILDLVTDVGALMLVSADTDLISMSPWRGVPILTPTQFANLVDGMRRHQNR